MNTYTRIATLTLLTALALCPPAVAQNVDDARYVAEVVGYTDIDTKLAGPMQAELVREVEAMLSAGEVLAPVPMQRGIGGQAVFWGSPAETIFTLCSAADLLPAELKAKALDRAKILAAKYPLWTVAWTDDGAHRELWPATPEALARKSAAKAPPPLSNLYVLWLYAHTTGDWKAIQDNWPAISALYKSSFSALKAAAVELKWPGGKFLDGNRVEGNIPGAAGVKPGSVELTITLADKSAEVFKDDGKGALSGSKGGKGTIDYARATFALTLGGEPLRKDATFKATLTRREPITYGWLSGVIGYARMARHIKAGDADKAWSAAVAAVKDIRATGYFAMYKLAYGQYGQRGAHDWCYPPFHVRREGDFTVSVLFAPEVGRLLSETDRQEVRKHVDSYITGANARAWFLQFGDMSHDSANIGYVDVAGGEGTGGENSYMPPDFGWAFFMLHAYVLHEPADKLRQWVDIPWAKAGDLYYIQRLLAAIRATGKESWKGLE